VKGLTTVNPSDVQLVNAEDLAKGNDVKALSEALTKNQTDIEGLRAALGANQTIGTMLAADPGAAAMKPSVKDVVAADVSPDGKVILYYWKKPGGSQ
jgi:hypothetical protein